MRDNAVDGILFCGCVEFIDDDGVGNLGPRHVSRRVDVFIGGEVQAVGFVHRSKLLLACARKAVREAELAIVRAHLDQYICLGKLFGIRMIVHLILDDYRHVRSKTSVFERIHTTAAPVFVAQLDCLNVRRAITSIEQVTQKATQGLFVDFGQTIALGIFFIAQKVPRGQNDRDCDPFIFGIAKRIADWQKRPFFAGHAVDHGVTVRIADVKVEFCEATTRIPQVFDAERADHIIKRALFSNAVIGSEKVPSEMRLREGCIR